MKQYNKYLLAGLMAVLVGSTSCTDYLDKAPESEISSNDAYKNFTNFQGFVEELYHCVPDFCKGYWTNSWNWGEDEILNVGIDYHMCYKVDQGDFWGWQSEHDGWQSGWMDRRGSSTDNDRFHKSLWSQAWYGIRKSNMGIEALNNGMLVGATQEEQNLIEGQLYFFRGWFHFQLIQFFGGLPYIDTVLPSGEKLTLARPTYHEVADKVAEDFRRAADVLPIDWEKTKVGSATMGKNELRINKIMALGYLGKNYLWAGSPLMNSESTGSKTYNQDYCKKAADAFAELLNLVENGETQYALVNYEKMDDVFFTYGQGGMTPGSTEAIFRSPTYGSGWNATNFGLSKQFGGGGQYGEGGVSSLPTANYVNYYGMANGLPLDDPNSGFDKTHPWRDRDPRFYRDIRFDGCQMVKGSLDTDLEYKRYASLATNGTGRDATTGSRTGYFLYKFIPLEVNVYDKGWDWSPQFTIQVSYMRLADIYLMFAESAAAGYGSPTGKSSKCSLTAIDAVNKIRTRAGVEDVDAKFTGSLDKFMSEVRRERAVELSYEGHRFNDLRRWLLLTEHPYTIKTSQEFIRAGEIDKKDPTNNEVNGWSEKIILTREFTDKHYWLPLKKVDTSLYAEFAQNPGW